MYELLYFNDFPKCQNYKILVRDANKNNLIDECKKRLKQTEYCTSKTMLCIIKDKQVVHPVISNLKGGTAHPRQEGWIWLSGKKYTTEEREQNHKKFTEKLKSHMQGIITSPMIAIKKSVVSNSQVKQDTSAENEKKAIKATKITRTKEKKTDTPAISLEESKRILQQNFDKLQKEYRRKFNIDFIGSEDFKLFFPSKDEFDKIVTWNNNVKDRNDLIDITGFYELCLGSPENADIIVLGKNPGAGGFDRLKSDQEFEELFEEMSLRKDAESQGCFFPLYNESAMKFRPWFPARLIFGIGVIDNGNGIKLPDENRNEKRGILSKFIRRTAEASKFAKKICSIELVPYHTADFAHGENLIPVFGMEERVLTPVRNAMKKGKIILFPYSSAYKDVWVKYIPELKNYDFAYTTHRLEGKKTAEAVGSMRIDKLRHVKNIKKERAANENCDAIFKRLEELGWVKI